MGAAPMASNFVIGAKDLPFPPVRKDVSAGGSKVSWEDT